MESLLDRGFGVRRRDAAVDVSSPQPITERIAVGGAALYALAIVVEAVRSRAWIAAVLFAAIAATALCVAAGRVVYRLGPRELVVESHFPTRSRAVRLPTSDVMEFVAVAGIVRVITRGGAEVDLPRGTMRSHDEARALATFLHEHLFAMREREASYRSF